MKLDLKGYVLRTVNGDFIGIDNSSGYPCERSFEHAKVFMKIEDATDFKRTAESIISDCSIMKRVSIELQIIDDTPLVEAEEEYRRAKEKLARVRENL